MAPAVSLQEPHGQTQLRVRETPARPGEETEEGRKAPEEGCNKPRWQPRQRDGYPDAGRARHGRQTSYSLARLGPRLCGERLIANVVIAGIRTRVIELPGPDRRRNPFRECVARLVDVIVPAQDALLRPHRLSSRRRGRPRSANRA